MDIQRFRISNLGHFQQLEADLAPSQLSSGNVTVFIGNNGAGKTSVLMALATSLSWFVARLRSEKGSGSPIPEDAILNGQVSASIDIAVFDDQGQFGNADADISDHLYHWTLTKTAKGKKASASSNLQDATRLAEHYRRRLTAQEDIGLPLVAFYPVERVVLDIPLKIKSKHSFLQLDGYDNSLNQGVDFRRFFEWFREREDSENETGLPEETLDTLLKSAGKGSDIWNMLQDMKVSSKDRQLTAVRTAIASFMPDFSNLRVRRKPRLHMSIDKDGKTLNVSQLSQGEKSLIALVGDIARRLAMMNPDMDNPLQGDGIVLIDEVDMHLHPSWQRRIIQQLMNTFPNCQFVLTTHSPLVISECKDAFIYSLSDGEITMIPSQYGQDANTVLLDVMDTNIRNALIAEQLNNALDSIQCGELNEARSLLHELAHVLPSSNLELSKAKLLLRKQELRHEKNH